MYLISIYFDEKTDRKIRSLIQHVAQKTGNHFMEEHHVPPHITVSAIETKREQEVLACLERVAQNLQAEEIQWVSTGAFLPQVMYIEPVLNAYLHQLSEMLFQELSQIPETIVTSYYRPFGWLPHCTIGKQLSKEQMQQAFAVLQNKFTPFTGTVVKLGIAKTNPHRDIKVWELKN